MPGSHWTGAVHQRTYRARAVIWTTYICTYMQHDACIVCGILLMCSIMVGVYVADM